MAMCTSVTELRSVVADRIGSFCPAKHLAHETFAALADRLTQIVLDEMRKSAVNAIQNVPFRDIVEDRVMGFSVAEMERIVRECASTELRWITALGFLIGAAVGALQPLVSRMFSQLQ